MIFIIQVNCELFSASLGYVYKPPEQIDYTGNRALEKFKFEKYPVYNESKIPHYIFEYKTSGNKYCNLLAGLALYNLAVVSTDPSIQAFHEQFTALNDTECRFTAVTDQDKLDVMEVTCEAVTSFLFENLRDKELNRGHSNTASINDSQFVGQPVSTSRMFYCSIEYNNNSFSWDFISKQVPCDILALYSEMSLFSTNAANIFKPVVTGVYIVCSLIYLSCYNKCK